MRRRAMKQLCRSLRLRRKKRLRTGRQQGGYARQRPALEPFEEGAARRGYVGELAGNAGGIERGHRVAAPGYRNELAGLGLRRCRARERKRAFAERRYLEGAERAVP